MTKTKLPPVPRHRIPSFLPACPKCGWATRTVLSYPYTQGYFRRHVCKNPACNTPFYSMSSYHTEDRRIHFRPFKDEEPSPLTIREREQWAAEGDSLDVPKPGVDSRILPAHPFVVQLNSALTTHPNIRTPSQAFMVDVFNSMVEETEKMNAEQGGTGSQAGQEYPDPEPDGDGPEDGLA